MSKNDQNFDRFQEGDCALRGVARRTALASWGENKGGEKCPRLKHNACSATSSSTSGFKGPMRTKTIENKTNNIRQLGLGRFSTYNLTRRFSLPCGPGGGLPSPLGGHRRPPAIFRHARPSLVAGHLSKAFFEVLEVLLLDVGVLSVFRSLFS